MINTSREYKEKILRNRIFYAEAEIQLADGTILHVRHDETRSDIMQGGFKIEDGTSSSGSFDIGAAVINQLTLRLDNSREQYSRYDFTGAVIRPRIGLKLTNSVEWMNKGVFVADEAAALDNTVNITALDHMERFDRPYSASNLSYPATLQEIVRDACAMCGVTLATQNFDLEDYVVRQRPETEVTFRDVLAGAAQISGNFCRCNTDGRLEFKWYDFSVFGKNGPDGGHFDLWDRERYLSGDEADGGSFQPWNAGSRYDAGTFQDMEGYHHLYALTGLVVCSDDVVVTGIRVSADEEHVYQAGEDGYVLAIEKNPLIEVGREKEIAEHLGEKMVGICFRPLTAKALSDPSIEAGDAACVSDRKGNSYQTVLTNIEFSLGEAESFTCDAQTPSRRKATRYSDSTAIAGAKKETQKQISRYDLAVQDMVSVMANSLGVFETVEETENGGRIVYQHDKPVLTESAKIWKRSEQGFMVSTDGGKTWNAGLDASGNAVLNVLSVIGLNAQWIDTGRLAVKDRDGNITFLADVDTGEVRIVADSFALSSGQTIESIAASKAGERVDDFISSVYDPKIASLQSQIDGQIETWYYDYEPTLSNPPASGWKAEADKVRHEGDLFYWKSKGYSYRFFKDGTVWKWQLITDSDITKALANAASAQDTADAKRRIFITQPKPPYDAGDLWAQGSSGDIKVCRSSRESGNYMSSDWELASDYIDEGTATTIANAAVDAQTQTDVLNKLTNNGEDEGIYLLNGKLYISFSAARGGELTLGGAGNVNGVLKILNASKKVVGTWDNEGAEFTDPQKGTSFRITGARLSSIGPDGDEYGSIAYSPESSSFGNGINITSRYGGVMFTVNTSSVGMVPVWTQAISILSQERKAELGYSNNIIFHMPPYFKGGFKADGTITLKTLKLENITASESARFDTYVFMNNLPITSSGDGLVIRNDNGGSRVCKVSSSSERYKEPGAPLNAEDIDGLYNITPRWAKYKEGYLSADDERHGTEFPMFIAEDVEKYAPLAVDHNENGLPENWNHRVMIPYMFQMIKSQKKIIDILERRIEALERKMEVT